jgi:hypothetical protein
VKTRLAARVVASATIAVSLLGCAVRAGQLPPTPWRLPEPSAKPSIALAVAVVSVEMDGTPLDAGAGNVSRWHEQILDTYADSRLFSGVLELGAPADLRAEVRISESVESSELLLLMSRLTLFVIPNRTVDRLSMKTEFKDAKGDVLLSVDKSESLTSWAQLFLAPAMPFQHPVRVGNEIVRDLARATLGEAQAQGVL